MNQVNQTEVNAVEQATQPTPEVTPQPKPTLIHTLLHAINEHIDTQVNEKVSAVLEAHSAVRYIDEAFKDAIGDIALNRVKEHEDIENHFTQDEVRELVDDIITEQVRREIRDTDISDQVHDAITDYDFDDKIETYLSDNDYIDNDAAIDLITETVEEMLEKKVMEVLIKLLEKLNGV